MKFKYKDQTYIVHWRHHLTSEYVDYLDMLKHIEKSRTLHYNHTVVKVKKPKKTHLTYCEIKGENNEILGVGHAYCSSKDQFNKHIGRCISMFKATQFLEIPMSVLTGAYESETNKKVK